jgi:hypothetical protein
MRRSSTAEATARLLRDLLTNRVEYRRVWMQHAKRHRSEELSQAGIAQAIALHLWESGDREDTDTALPRELRTRVRRALAGQVLSAETLDWIIRSFRMDEYDEACLWATFSSWRDEPNDGVANTAVQTPEMIRPQMHRTLALFERYDVAESGALARRTVMQIIMAIEGDVDKYLLVHEDSADKIDVVHGGSLGPSRDYAEGLLVSDIAFANPLRRGQRVSLNYTIEYPRRNTFHEVRRLAYGRCENVDLAITFADTAKCSQLWWSVWPNHRSEPVVFEQDLSLNQYRAAHRFLPFIEQTVVGFRWDCRGAP